MRGGLRGFIALLLMRTGPASLSAAVATVSLIGAAAASADAHPVRVGAETGIDVVSPQVATAASGAVSVAYSQLDIDDQTVAGALVASASPHGGFGPARAVPGAQSILALGYAGTALELITASGATGQPCCTMVQAVRARPDGFGAPQPLVADVGGGAIGRVVPLANGRLLAVIAGPQGLWASEATRSGRFGVIRQLAGPLLWPVALAATATSGGGAAIAWTDRAGRAVRLAVAGPGATPQRSRLLLSVAAGHSVDEVGLAATPSGETLAFTESHVDGSGVLEARVWAQDVSPAGRPFHSRARALSPAAGAAASGLTLAGDGIGDEAAAWEQCNFVSGGCRVDDAVRLRPAAVRRSGRRRSTQRRPTVQPWFLSADSPGAIDPDQAPQVAIGAKGRTVVGWIEGGRLQVVTREPSQHGFGPSVYLSGDLVDDSVIAVGAGGLVTALWTQGTSTTSVFATRGQY